MAKNDLKFQKIISNERFADSYNVVPSKYPKVHPTFRVIL